MILAVGRAERFSPNSADKDAAILGGVCGELERMGFSVGRVSETDLAPGIRADAWLTMGRLPSALGFLASRQSLGEPVVNSPEGIALCCDRQRLTAALGRAGVPVPPESGAHGVWLKRAHGVAESEWDVRYADDDSRAVAVEAEMRRHGVTEVMRCAHVPGDLVKFYGVGGTDFFRFFYPGDDGMTKFGDERRNGRPRHYAFSEAALRSAARLAARTAGTAVYGGDCIVRPDGSLCIIDFNDWPSFSRCRAEAARAIAAMVAERLSGTLLKKRAL